MGSNHRILCVDCGTEGEQVRIVNESWLLAFLLLLLFILPGVLYIAYCHSKAYWGCPRCRSRKILPLDAPSVVKLKAAESADLDAKENLRVAAKNARGEELTDEELLRLSRMAVGLGLAIPSTATTC